SHSSCFFFQAEDGIRDFHVTGVQTCALPISLFSKRSNLVVSLLTRLALRDNPHWHHAHHLASQTDQSLRHLFLFRGYLMSKVNRSEERRVGKSVDLDGH